MKADPSWKKIKTRDGEGYLVPTLEQVPPQYWAKYKYCYRVHTAGERTRLGKLDCTTYFVCTEGRGSLVGGGNMAKYEAAFVPVEFFDLGESEWGEYSL